MESNYKSNIAQTPLSEYSSNYQSHTKPKIPLERPYLDLSYIDKENNSLLLNQHNISCVSYQQPLIANNRDITTVKAFKFNEKTDLSQQILQSKLRHLQKNPAACSRSTTVKKECHCHSNKRHECQCKSQYEKLMNVSFTCHNCSNVQRSSYINTPVINMEHRFDQQSNSKYQIWNDYQDQPKIIVSCSPLSSLKHSMQHSYIDNLKFCSNDMISESANKLSTIHSQASASSSVLDKNTMCKPLGQVCSSIQNSNNINISKLTDGSAVSKQSIQSSGGQLDKILGSNSQNNFFLKPNTLLEMKNGMLASAEMTQGNSNSCQDDNIKSNSSLPMFSPLKESDLIISKKITPRTGFNMNNNIQILKTNTDHQSSSSIKQSLQVYQLQSAIQNLNPFDLKSPTQQHSLHQSSELLHSKSYADNSMNNSLMSMPPMMNRIMSYPNDEESSRDQSLNFTLTESNLTQHNPSQLPRSRQETHRVTATFIQIDDNNNNQ